MNLGLRRGLATSAVSALAITGLAVTAPPAGAADAPAIRMITQLGGVVSTRPAGSGYYDDVEVVAEVADPTSSVDFEINPDPRAADDDAEWTALPNSVQVDGHYVSTTWRPTLDHPGLVGTSVAIRAVLAGGPTPVYATRRDVVVAAPHSETDTVRLDRFRGGYFVQPYADSGRTASLVGLSGTTSATGGSVALEHWRPASSDYRGLTNAQVRPTDIKGYTGEVHFELEGGEFDAVLPLAVFDTEDGGGVAVRASLGTDDVATGTTYRQEIGSLSHADPTTITSTGSTVDLTVLDTQNQPVAGAEVRRSDGELLGYTNGAGVVSTTQAHDTRQTYFVNTTDDDAWEDGVDRSVTVTTPAFVRAATELVPVLADGPVFDDQECAVGDVALQVVDQEGRPFPGTREVTYRVHPTESSAPTFTTATTDSDGRLVVPFDPAGPDGSWTLEHAVTGQYPVYRRSTFVAGDARLTLTPGAGRAASGGEIAYTGRLSVAGRPLAGRRVDLAYARGTELAPGAGADAGLGSGRSLTASATTAADGSFTVTVDDPAEKGSPTEKGGRLTVTAPSAAATASASTTFGSGKGAFRLRLTGTGRGGRDKLDVVGSAGSRGERVRVLVQVGRTWKTLRSARLDRRGRLRLSVEDRNGPRVTRYSARLLESARTRAARSGVEKLR